MATSSVEVPLYIRGNAESFVAGNIKIIIKKIEKKDKK